MSSGVPLDHLDYHNHILALHTPFHQIVREIAVEKNLPIRNPVPVSSYRKIKVSSGGGDSAAISKLIVYGMLHPFKSIPMMKKVGVDVFYENADNETFLSIIDQLPNGVSEIMCHPGSSESEIKILTNPEIKSKIEEKGIVLTDFTSRF